MEITIKLAKNVGVEDVTGIEVISDMEYAELLQNRLEVQYPDADIEVESTYDLVERVYIEIEDGEDYGRHWVENTIAHIREELWVECLEALN